ncbi:MAG TPA: FliI/YscN family ATPase [Planctomycetota bacterium]|nr:FliI/YscN family ATPase [Planctomycetota bacterium]
MPLNARHAAALARARAENRPTCSGRVVAVEGLALHVRGLRVALGDTCVVRTARGVEVPAEVVGFQGDAATLMPLGEREGIACRDVVEQLGRPWRVPTGPALLGRVVDALGRPLDGAPPPVGPERPLVAPPPAALSRPPIAQSLVTGVSAIDGFLTCGRGQRLGIFAGSGVGKSTLLGSIARASSADVNVIALIGERGREVNEFLHDVLGPEGLARSVVVVSTSDTAPMLRLKGALTAVTIAESFRDQGKDVLLVMDSITRLAFAAREIGLAAGEPPTLRGYPPSLFALLPALVERLGTAARGSITGLLTVLVDGDDFNEPVSDALRGYLDGHVVLSRDIAARGRFPAIDVLASVSRVMDRVVGPAHAAAARAVRRLIAHWQENRDLVAVGAYRKGSDPLLDEALAKLERIEELLYHGRQSRSFERTCELLGALAGAALLGGGS